MAVKKATAAVYYQVDVLSRHLCGATEGNRKNPQSEHRSAGRYVKCRPPKYVGTAVLTVPKQRAHRAAWYTSGIGAYIVRTVALKKVLNCA
jgi:hypothetical protein